ncbi:centromere protein C isoform X6 [Prunus avium]|uniref:Centromere protein C isoform X6 n=1 Tax=Prunus avium TaxID=42229 RepID=A0A6P5TNF3_PRUAV|nr:centromere protein C isoform X6 [Prunus avium]
MNEVQSSDPVDPLQGYTGLAVFPNSGKILPDNSKPYDIADDLQTIHTQLKSVALQQSPTKLKDLAKNIVSGTSEIPKSVNPQALKQKDAVVPEMAEENPRQQRRALGRKRARFSVKPNSSQPAMSLLPPLDIKNLKDTEELWTAYERHENAKKEIEKQMGGAVLDADQQNPSPIKRSRQPGILGRSAKYKPLYPSTDAETSVNGKTSQDMLETRIHSPLNHSSQAENKDVALEEVDLAGATAKADKELGEILHDLLSKNCEDLEGDGAVSLLQEQLKIKPIKMKKLSLPEFPSIRKVDYRSSRRTLPKPTNVLTDVDNLVKGIRSKTPAKRKQEAEGSINLAFPTPPKSPFASISALKKRILQSNPSSDPFSADDIDRFLGTNPSLVENGNKQSELVDTRVQETVSDELKLIKKTDNFGVPTGSPEVAIEEFSHAFERSISEDSSKHGESIDVGSSRSHLEMEDDIESNSMDNRVMDGTLSRPDAHTDTWENGANDGDKVEDTLEEALDSAEPELNESVSTLEKSNGTQNELEVEEHPTDGLSRNLDTGPETHNERIQEHSGASLNKQIKANSRPRRKQKSKEVSKRQSRAGVCSAVDEDPADGRSRNLDSGSETHNEIMQEPSGASLNQQIKATSPQQRKRKSKEVSKRQSLAGAGTLWQSGVRRSTRIKTRPLEFWKGERLLIGRIHESLPTVIGMKYASPGKGDGKAPLKIDLCFLYLHGIGSSRNAFLCSFLGL